MQRGKLIVIEGTDCSGKETQSNMLIERLNQDGISVSKFSFPAYDTPTGRIVGGPYLGKSYICDGWFKEDAVNVDPKVASLYYAADRKYNIDLIEKQLANGVNVILDRYIYSNMAHQGGKIGDKEERTKMYKWLEVLEFELLELPHADIRIFLHMPYEASLALKAGRIEALDEHERNKEHLVKTETAYVELAKKYNFSTIECTNKNGVRTIEDIHAELYNYVKKKIGNKAKQKRN